MSADNLSAFREVHLQVKLGRNMQSIYRAERPETFAEIIGQNSIVRILQNQLKEGTINHAYLFAGLHGTGKTSTARIFAKALNCSAGEIGKASASKIPCGKCESCQVIKEGRHVDVIEIDAASNNGVEDLRNIIETVKYPPSVGKYKIYIIDEVHMLSQSAENAFLKTLEEPPEYAVFILATTDPSKVRSTIRSRCLELYFKRVSEKDIIEGLDRICTKYNASADAEALKLIARNANGSVRDAFSLLEECLASSKELSKDIILDLTGTQDEMFFSSLIDCTNAFQTQAGLEMLISAISQGSDARELLKDWLLAYRNLLICKFLDSPDEYIGFSKENSERLKEQAKGMEISRIQQGIELLTEYLGLAKYSDRPEILLEAALVKLSGYMSYDIGAASFEPAPTPKATSKTEVRTKPAATKMPEKSAPAPSHKKSKESETNSKAGGLAGDMWKLLVNEISQSDSSFEILVGMNSQGILLQDNLLTVNVRKNKFLIAKSYQDRLEEAGRKRYGENFGILLQEGDIGVNDESGEAATEEEIKELEQMIGKPIEITE